MSENNKNESGTDNKKKSDFVVEISDEDLGYESSEQPTYKGEVYFSNPPVVNRRNDESEKKAVRPSPQTAKTKKKPGGSMKKKRPFSGVISLVAVIIVICSVTLSGIAISCINDVLALNRSEELVTVKITEGMTTNEVIDILHDGGLIKQKVFCKIFVQVASKLKETPINPEYLSGIYYVKAKSGIEGMLVQFRNVQTTPDTVRVSFPEGFTVYQMIERLDESGVCKADYLFRALEEVEFEFGFVKNIEDNNNRTSKLEGYFFPDTYDFFENSDANSIIRKLLQNFEKKWTDKYEARAKELGYTMDEIITIASIIQREAANADQMPLVSSVIHNRLKNPGSYPTLGCDATLNYINSFVKPVLNDDSLTKYYAERYNTHTNRGLPPGPICCPGSAAIEAALYPEKTANYYFVHDKYGNIYLAETGAKHDANRTEVWRVNGQ